MDVGIVILCPDKGIEGLRTTLTSVKHYSYDRESICVVGNNTTAKELKDMNLICPTYAAKDTITSLVNEGMAKLQHEWGFIIFSGSKIKAYTERKLETFCKSDSDILFPVITRPNPQGVGPNPIPIRIWGFIGGSFNGVLINKKFFEKVGDFPSTVTQKEGMNDFELAKMLWYMEATNQGAIFKSIIGMKII